MAEFRPSRSSASSRATSSRLRNASAIDLTQFAGLNVEQGPSRAKRRTYASLIAEAKERHARAQARPFDVTLVGRWVHGDGATTRVPTLRADRDARDRCDRTSVDLAQVTPAGAMSSARTRLPTSSSTAPTRAGAIAAVARPRGGGSPTPARPTASCRERTRRDAQRRQGSRPSRLDRARLSSCPRTRAASTRLHAPALAHRQGGTHRIASHRAIHAVGVSADARGAPPFVLGEHGVGRAESFLPRMRCRSANRALSRARARRRRRACRRVGTPRQIVAVDELARRWSFSATTASASPASSTARRALLWKAGETMQIRARGRARPHAPFRSRRARERDHAARRLGHAGGRPCAGSARSALASAREADA